MKNWNAIVTINQFHFKEAFRLLEPLGRVARTRFYNVLAMQVEDVDILLETLREWMQLYPDTPETISRVAPVRETFQFEDAETFHQEAGELLKQHLPELAGKSFHVRVHRRGETAGTTNLAAERELGRVIFEALQATDCPARVSFDDPDVVVCIETLDSRGGLALWNREQREAYPFVRVH